jgi:hypothetical protein
VRAYRFEPRFVGQCEPHDCIEVPHGDDGKGTRLLAAAFCVRRHHGFAFGQRERVAFFHKREDAVVAAAILNAESNDPQDDSFKAEPSVN